MKKNLLTAEQIAKIFGISKITVIKLGKAGEIPCEYIGRRPMFCIERIFECFQKIEGGAA